MNKNIGSLDRTIRIVAGLALIGYGVMAQSWLGAIGLIPLLTALVNWCPLYTLLKISTCK